MVLVWVPQLANFSFKGGKKMAMCGFRVGFLYNLFLANIFNYYTTVLFC